MRADLARDWRRAPRRPAEARRRVGARWLPIAAALLLGACAAKAPPPPPPAPLFPAFEYPGLLTQIPGLPPVVLARHDEGWRQLQAGQPRVAARIFVDLIKGAPAFYPAKAGLGYAELADRDYRAAVAAFDAAIAQQPGYLPALAGRAEALVAADKPIEAIGALEALLAADPSRSGARSRLESLRFGAIETLVAEARAARQRGDLEAARTLWTRAVQTSPESAFMLRELAALERETGRLDDALGHAMAAVMLDDREPAGHALVGEVELGRGNLDAALQAFRRAEERAGRGEYATRIAEIEKRIDFAAMPEAFRAIGTSPGVTRADVAALLGVRLERWLAAAPATAVSLMTDVRGHWAQRWILQVTRVGLMEPFPNHTFQPGQPVRRADLARIVARALDRAAEIDPRVAARRPRPAQVDVSDVPETNEVRAAVTAAVGSGVMALDETGAFGPARSVTGAEATAAVERLAAILDRP